MLIDVFSESSGRHTSNRNDKYIRLVGCCLLGAWRTVDKDGIGQLFNDLVKGNVCAKPYELMRKSLWVSRDKCGL